jgi:hypothetical protein
MLEAKRFSIHLVQNQVGHGGGTLLLYHFKPDSINYIRINICSAMPYVYFLKEVHLGFNTDLASTSSVVQTAVLIMYKGGSCLLDLKFVRVSSPNQKIHFEKV